MPRSGSQKISRCDRGAFVVSSTNLETLLALLSLSSQPRARTPQAVCSAGLKRRKVPNQSEATHLAKAGEETQQRVFPPPPPDKGLCGEMNAPLLSALNVSERVPMKGTYSLRPRHLGTWLAPGPLAANSRATPKSCTRRCTWHFQARPGGCSGFAGSRRSNPIAESNLPDHVGTNESPEVDRNAPGNNFN